LASTEQIAAPTASSSARWLWWGWAVLLLIAVAVALLGRAQGAAMWIGLLLGTAAAAQVAVLLDALRPIAALIVAVRPLALPLLLLIAAGTVESPLVLQLVAGIVAMLVAWHVLIRPEAPRYRPALDAVLEGLRSGRGNGRRLIRGALVLAAAIVVILGFLWLPSGDTLEDRGGAASFFFSASVVLLGAAVLLRLLGYSSTRLRALVSLCVLLAIVRAAMELGLLPFHDELHDAVPWLTPGRLFGFAALATVAAGLLDVVIRREAERGNVGSPIVRAVLVFEGPVPLLGRTRPLSLYGLSCCVLATIALFAAMVGAAYPGRATGALVDDLDPVAPRVLAPGTMSDRELAETFSPVLLFSERARWSPVPVEGYLGAASITDWERRPVTKPIDQLTDCPGIVTAPCYTLTIRCDDGDAPCAQGAPNPTLAPRRDGAAYVRVVRRTRPPADGSPNPFERVADLREQPTVLLQYWYFYPYDEWISPVLPGQLRQRHEADWEAVTIGFSDRAPLFVGFSEHCGGQWYEWDDVRVRAAGSRLRPLVAVADGSQANYRYPNPAQAPDWSGCASLPPKTLTLVSYASNIRDRVGADWTWEPAEHLLVDARRSPMSFVGRWAPFSRTELDTLYRDQKLGPDAAGPATPTLQALWREPLRTIFRSSNWHPGS
jgi:hypothetical protein